ncbi:hypothetical protein [Thalassospira sp.]|uniref:hypothetical protein n=1 Tax=Thalassospira sp. TaxID=1912094 RepID=UPI000C4818F4|nr:hypothetical protein [Thalassospira sp.]MBC05972.1 hypothetical protein [Thalassospira sp.]|tara:strand:+ start:1122 stop:1853 length:732 start_codon:yes stop_codon:yes gene_type:complete
MTREHQKHREKEFVLKASKLLGTEWKIIEQREQPDFILKEKSQVFGLEVREIFVDDNRRNSGSKLKKAENYRSKELEKFAHNFQKQLGFALHVRLVRRPQHGNISVEELNQLEEALISENLHLEEIGYHNQVELKCGTKVWLTKEIHSRWYVVNDLVGLVHHAPGDLIQSAIDMKSSKLDVYRNNAGSDIRLLLSANRTKHSGKLILTSPIAKLFDLGGFSEVYFMSYPMEAYRLQASPKPNN